MNDKIKSTKTLLIYSRISSHKIGNDDASLDAQEALGRAFAEKEGYTVLGTFSEVKSGGRMDNRSEWNSLVLEAKKTKSTIWIYSISRMSRSVIDFLTTLEDFKKLGIGLHSHSEDIDTSSNSASKALHLSILSTFSEYERKLAGERTATALGNLKASGKRYCRKVPFGKTLSDCGSKFLRNKKEETVILKMKNLRIEGFSYQKIADILNRESFPTREGRPWIKTSVNMILKREAAEATALAA
jgi:site-specific DNA recombinase